MCCPWKLGLLSGYLQSSTVYSQTSSLLVSGNGLRVAISSSRVSGSRSRQEMGSISVLCVAVAVFKLFHTQTRGMTQAASLRHCCCGQTQFRKQAGNCIESPKWLRLRYLQLCEDVSSPGHFLLGNESGQFYISLA